MPESTMVLEVGNTFCSVIKKSLKDKQACIGFSSELHKNKQHCSHCYSKWRICPSCILQGDAFNQELLKSGEVFVNHQKGKGLCSYHSKHGAEEKRGVSRRFASVELGDPDRQADEDEFTGSPEDDEDEGSELALPARAPDPPEPPKPEPEKEEIDLAGLPKTLVELLKKLGIKVLETGEFKCGEIRPFAGQPRKKFDGAELKALAESIRSVGQTQNILIRRLVKEERKEDSGHKYELIDGERRWRACELNGQKVRGTIVEVKGGKDICQFIISCISNFGREPNTPLETALALKKIKDETGATDAFLAAMFAKKSAAWVGQHLSLMNLSLEVRKLLENESLSFSMAVSISKVPDKKAQLKIAHEVVEKKLPLNSGRRLLRETVKEHDIQMRGRKRKPNDDYRIFRSFLQRTEETVGHHLSAKEVFLAMFAHRDTKDITTTQKELKALAKKFSDLAENLFEKYSFR